MNNTVLIAKGCVIGFFLTSVAISMLWGYNVSRIALSDFKSKLYYSTGAGCGAVSGYYVINFVI